MNQAQDKPKKFWSEGQSVPFGPKGECVVPIIAGLFRVSGFGLGVYFAANHEVHSVDLNTARSMAEADGVPCIVWTIDDTNGLAAYQMRVEQMRLEPKADVMEDLSEKESTEMKRRFKDHFEIHGCCSPLPEDLEALKVKNPLEWDEACAEFNTSLRFFGFGEAPEAKKLGYVIREFADGTQEEIRQRFVGDLIAVKGAALYGRSDAHEWAIMAKPVKKPPLTPEERKAFERKSDAAYEAVEAHARRLDIEGDHEEKVRQLLISLHEYCGCYAVDLPRQFDEVRRQIDSGEIASPEWNEWYGPVDQACANG